MSFLTGSNFYDCNLCILGKLEIIMVILFWNIPAQLMVHVYGWVSEIWGGIRFFIFSFTISGSFAAEGDLSAIASVLNFPLFYFILFNNILFL